MSIVKTARRSWRMKLTGALVALAVSAVGAVGMAAPAAAAPGDCSLGYHCNYSGYDYGNDAFQGPSTHRFLNCVDDMYIGLRSYKNTTSSAFNNGRTQTSYLYSGVQKTGSFISLFVGQGTANLGTRAFNDAADSGYFSSTLGSAGSTLWR